MLLAKAAADSDDVQPVYVSVGLAWEEDERTMAAQFVATLPRLRPMKTLTVDMTDVYPSTHWAIRGEAPGFDTPDSDVYLEGRNVILLSKAAVYMARTRSPRVLIGLLAGNPFPDSSRGFFDAMENALSAGLAFGISIDAPFSAMTKADVIRLGQTLGVPLRAHAVVHAAGERANTAASAASAARGATHLPKRASATRHGMRCRRRGRLASG